MDYEVRCHVCDVSFPMGTKRCLYCGARPTAAHRSEAKTSIENFFESAIPANEASEMFDMPGETDAPEEEQKSVPGMLSRMMGGLTWLLLLGALSVYRACAG
jgi:hypothetical protein